MPTIPSTRSSCPALSARGSTTTTRSRESCTTSRRSVRAWTRAALRPRLHSFQRSSTSATTRQPSTTSVRRRAPRDAAGRGRPPPPRRTLPRPTLGNRPGTAMPPSSIIGSTETGSAKERERAGLRKDMPLHRVLPRHRAAGEEIQGLLDKLISSPGTTNSASTIPSSRRDLPVPVPPGVPVQ